MNFNILQRSAALVAWLCLLVEAPSAQTLRIGYEDWAPHQYPDAHGKPAGLDIDLINAIFEKAGFKAEFHLLPWQRTLVYVEAGQLDIALSAARTPEREVYATFSEPYKFGFNALFVRAADAGKLAGLTSLQSLIGKRFRLGVVRGTSYSTEYDGLITNPDFSRNLEYVNSNSQNLEKLLANRIDGFLDGVLSGSQAIEKAGSGRQVKVGFYLIETKGPATYLMFSKKTVSPAYVERINRAIRELHSDGSYRNILSRYTLDKQ